MAISVGGLALVGSIIAINGFLGSIVIARNPRAALNRTFLLMVFGITLWASASALSDATTSFEVARLSSFVAFGASFFGFCMTYLFSEVFRQDRLHTRHYSYMTFGIVLSILFATPLVYSLDTIDDYHNGILYFPYILCMLGVLFFIIKNFLSVVRHGSNVKRSHAKLIVSGFAAMSVLALITNAIIPALIDITWITKVGPLFTSIFIGSVAYSMIRHRLFDMRLAVARTVAYVLTLAVIATIYSVLLIGVLSHFIEMKYASWIQQFAYVAMAVILSSTFQPIKRFFDKITNRLFYQDAYDPQQLVDQLNKALVSSLDIKFLATKSSTIIAEHLKSAKITIGVYDSEKHLRVYGSGKAILQGGELKEAVKLMPTTRYKVITADFLEDRHDKLRSILRNNSVAAIIRLTQNAHRGDAIGYVFVGDKKSGNMYSDQDVRVLENIGNELVIAFQNALHFEEIQRFNVLLQTRVDEATRRLRRTNEKLKTLDETKDDFISMASHQLRTPLTSIKGYLSMVLEGDAGEVNETQQKMLGQAFVSSQRMVYLISDLLNVSRLKTGKFIIDAAPTNLAQMVNEEIDQLVETAAGKQIKLTYDKPKEFPELMLDETKTRQVIMNFVDNALYYTPSGGAIRVELVDAPTSVELKVIDNGIGVPKTEQHHLFTKFYRAGNARKARPDGTGLGLFMAKKVILAQGGSILFESKEGKGSTFGFLFPKNHAHTVDKLPVAEAKETANTHS